MKYVVTQFKGHRDDDHDKWKANEIRKRLNALQVNPRPDSRREHDEKRRASADDHGSATIPRVSPSPKADRSIHQKTQQEERTELRQVRPGTDHPDRDRNRVAQ